MVAYLNNLYIKVTMMIITVLVTTQTEKNY